MKLILKNEESLSWKLVTLHQYVIIWTRKKLKLWGTKNLFISILLEIFKSIWNSKDYSIHISVLVQRSVWNWNSKACIDCSKSFLEFPEFPLKIFLFYSNDYLHFMTSREFYSVANTRKHPRLKYRYEKLLYLLWKNIWLNMEMKCKIGKIHFIMNTQCWWKTF